MPHFKWIALQVCEVLKKHCSCCVSRVETMTYQGLCGGWVTRSKAAENTEHHPWLWRPGTGCEGGEVISEVLEASQRVALLMCTIMWYKVYLFLAPRGELLTQCCSIDFRSRGDRQMTLHCLLQQPQQPASHPVCLAVWPRDWPDSCYKWPGPIFSNISGLTHPHSRLLFEVWVFPWVVIWALSVIRKTWFAIRQCAWWSAACFTFLLVSHSESSLIYISGCPLTLEIAW